MRIGDRLEVTIEKMSLHGGGLARVDGRVVFVEHSAPGDRLIVEVTDVKPKHAFARVREILAPSAERRNPPCPAFGRCGGCNWQHLSDDAQAKWKEALVLETLQRAWSGPFEFLPIVRSPHVLRYRNRIQLKKNASAVGYFEKGSHRLVPIEDCLLAEEPLKEGIASLTKKPATAEVRNWEISLTRDGKAALNSMDERDLAFSQVNRFVNELLIAEVLAWAERNDWDEFWDLFCGSGNFTFPLAEKFPKRTGLGVELSSASIDQAQKESQRRGWSPKRIEFFRADVGLFLRRMTPSESALVLVDPPRTGLPEEAARALAFSQAKVLLYISCDPVTLARDLKRIQAFRPGRWTLTRARAFDMFPQTDHVETLVELKIDTSTSNVNV